MPTIDQIPSGQALSNSDEILVSQIVGSVRVTGKSTIAAMLSLLAGNAMFPSSLRSGVGVPSSGLGISGDSYVNASNGDFYQKASGTWTKIGSVQGATGPTGSSGSAYSLTANPVVTTMAGTDLVGISQGGADRTITLANALEGATIDQLTAATAAADSDVLVVGQGTSTMRAQTLSALWTWIQGHLPQWKRPVIEISTTTQLDGSIHTNAILVCSAPTTINPAFSTEGSGFTCTIINASSGAVTLGAGFVTSTGTLTIPVGQVGVVTAATYSGGNLNFVNVSVAAGASSISVPGSPSGLTVGTVTNASIGLSWTAPSTGGAPSSYAVQTSTDNATWGAPASASGTSYAVTGLAPSTAYYFRVAGINSAGTGAYTAGIGPTTTGAAAAFAPNLPTSVSVGTATGTTLPITWTAPATDSTHGAATTYTLQYSLHGANAWTQQSGIAATSYTITGLSTATQYDIQLQAVDSAGSSAFTATVNGTTATSGSYALSSGFQPIPTTFTHGATGLSLNVNDDTGSGFGSHTAPAQIYFGWTTSPTVPPSSISGLMPAQGSFSNSGSNFWYTFSGVAPPSAGTYYLWALAVDGSNAIRATTVFANSISYSPPGTPVAFTIT